MPKYNLLRINQQGSPRFLPRGKAGAGEAGVIHLLLPLILLLGIGVTVYLVTSGPLKLSPKAVESVQVGPINRKALLIIYDPILSNGQKLHELRGWADPVSATTITVNVINQSSGGAVNYQVAETVQRNEWPRKVDGFRYTEETYKTCMDSNNKSADCHSPDDMDYSQVWTDMNICSKVSSGAIDEVFIWGAPYFGFDEFAFKIPGDVMPYNNPTNGWLYDLRKKNIPACNGKTVFAMGWNYERGVAGPGMFTPGESLHSFGHRIESALALSVGRGYWDGCIGHSGVPSDFDQFTCVNKDITSSTPVTVAGCGNIHFPPNGLQDYDYANSQSVQNACSSWDNYPFSEKTVASQDCSAWGCSGDPQVNYLKWWMNHLPRKDGVQNGNLNNWWKYIVDFDNGVTEAKAPPSTPTPTPTPIPVPSPSPTPIPTPRADLTITAVNLYQNVYDGKSAPLSPTSVVYGTKVVFVSPSSVKNIGTLDTGTFKIRFCVDNANCLSTTKGRVGTDVQLGSLRCCGVSTTVGAKTYWKAATIGSHTVTACADVAKAITESDEANNCFSQTFSVYGPD